MKHDIVMEEKEKKKRTKNRSSIKKHILLYIIQYNIMAYLLSMFVGSIRRILKERA